MDRTTRQQEGVQKWIDKKCKGTLVYATGVGKTYTAVLCIKRFLIKNPGKRVLVVVPTQNLLEQWIKQLEIHGIFMVCDVKIINTIVKHSWTCDMLVLDEIHGYASDLFKLVFEKIKYSLILGLTATFERLDGKEILINQYCPVVDEISLGNALSNGWLSEYNEYKILLEVDLEEYKEADRQFQTHFSFFNYNFDLAMKCVTDYKARYEYAKLLYSGKDPLKLSEMNKIVLSSAMGFSQSLQKRKSFIYNHPKKIEITNLILSYKQDKKCITFSPTIKIAEQIKYGGVLHSKQTKKKRAMTYEDFVSVSTGVLNTSKCLDEGVDVPGLSVAVILSNSSSDRQKIQRIGRVIRKGENKKAEIFTLVIKGTVEEEWFRKSSEGNNYITLNEENLRNLLEGKEFSIKKNKETGLKFRF